jgi:hypothetical protein
VEKFAELPTATAVGKVVGEQASRGYEFRSLTLDVYRQSFGRGMRLISRTNSQMSSGY